MQTLTRGSRGPDVRFLQIVLNTHLVGRPRLRPDAVFGPGTEEAVRAFQQARRLHPDGVVGPTTWRELTAPVPRPAANVTRFVAQLGTMENFIDHVHQLETRHRSDVEVMTQLSDFTATAQNQRYLIIQRRSPGVIDFRHFFAAASEAHSAARSRRSPGIPLGGTRGDTLLLGVGNEVAQCVDEATRGQLNSCFAREDLGSNRLGAEFGRAVTIARAEGSRVPIHEMLRTYLRQFVPLSPRSVEQVRMPSNSGVVREALTAILLGVYDFLVHDAY